MPDQAFDEERRAALRSLNADESLRRASLKWIADASRHKYCYQYDWMGLPIIQFPQDIMAMQEIVWRVKPDLIIETGIARGGSLVFYASLLELIGGSGQVLGIDVEIRPDNRAALEQHALSKRITMLEGSSVAPDVFEKVREHARGRNRVLVILDSNHTHAHVARELELYSALVTRGSYLVVFDTVIEDLPAGYFHDRPWDRGNNPKTAVHEFLKTNDRFVVDRELEAKLLISVAPDGYLKCVKD